MIREIALNMASGALLVLLLAAVAYGADRWIDIHIRYHPNYLLWHEPLEDWNRSSGHLICLEDTKHNLPFSS
jgi:hypothetical protein